MKIRRILPVVFLLGCLPIHAAESPSSIPPSTAPVTDPVQVAAHYHQVLARPEYVEIAEPDIGSRLKDTLSLWFMRLGAKFGRFQYAGEMPVFASLLMTLMAVFAMTGVLYVIVRLTRNRGGMEAMSSYQDPGQKTFRPPEFYDDEIQRAIQQSDWHGAWLAAWRQFLSRLEHRQLVEADRTRTNREYLAQLRIQKLPAPVVALLAGMVDAYDRTIYGRQLIREPDWKQFHQQIEEAALLLHLHDKPAPSRIKPLEA